MLPNISPGRVRKGWEREKGRGGPSVWSLCFFRHLPTVERWKFQVTVEIQALDYWLHFAPGLTLDQDVILLVSGGQNLNRKEGGGEMSRAGELVAGTQMCNVYFVCTDACMYMYVCLRVGMVYVCACVCWCRHSCMHGGPRRTSGVLLNQYLTYSF